MGRISNGLNFEWDELKAQENLKKHGVGFEEAVTVFNDSFSLTVHDSEHSIDEERFIDIGTSNKGRLLVVVYTDRANNIRIISCRKHRRENGDNMKKAATSTSKHEDDIHAEYDFSKGVRGKHYRALQNGYTITIHQAGGTRLIQEVKPPQGAVILEPDVQAFFPDAEAVNKTLRSLIQLIPDKRKPRVKKQRT